jgi:hypothetical protein
MERRFRIALSFAGSQRSYVAQMAERLAQAVGRETVLYDKFHEAEFARSDLAFHLTKLYHEQSDLIVAVLSPEYESKEWCGLEWSAAFGLIKKRRPEEVMLLRFGLAEAEGTFDLAGYVDLDTRLPNDAADLILQRLALNQGLPREHYKPAASSATPPAADDAWPAIPPELDWPVADHSVAREAFARLLTRDPPYRYLPIDGPSGTGKSLLSNQFLGNALNKLPGVRCARLDFKGSAGLATQVQEWAEQLGVKAPSPELSQLDRIKQVVAELKLRPLPTLLIFDTFEASADAERWFRESLLVSALRSPWLRMVAIGQTVPRPEGMAWAGLSCRAIALTVPTPADWLRFCHDHLHLAHLELSFVAQAHAMVGGRATTLRDFFNNAAS